MVVVDKKNRTFKIIDFAVSGGSRIEEKGKEKIKKYQGLRKELQKTWNVRVKLIPLVVGSSGCIPKQFGNRLKETGITAQNWYHKFRKRFFERFLKSKTAGCGLILREFSSIVLLCVSPIILLLLIIINNNNGA